MLRREFLSLFAGAVFPSEQRRYPDPVTELEVLRLTDPERTSFLPRRGASRRGNFLLYATDRSGAMQVCRMDLKSGESRQLTDVEALDPATVTLLPDDRGFLFCQGDSLMLSQISGRLRTIGSTAGRSGPLSISEDGQYCAFAARERVWLASLGARPEVTAVCNAPGGAATVQIRPKRTQILYLLADGSPWLINFNGQAKRPLKLEPIANASAVTVEWTAAGRTFAYLRGSTLREHTPDENADRSIANTSQFAAFSANADASVFVGASQSRASSYLLLLLRVTRREFTLCEHHDANATQVRPVFTPNSQSVLFQSDRHGKPAIYRMRIEKLVESTDEDTGQ